jgi:TPR repeat protein
MVKTGVAYEKGDGGLPKDTNEAIRWYRKAADAAMGAVWQTWVCLTRTGIAGLPKDAEQAVRWYRKAAQLGSSNAKAALTRLQR